MAKSKKSARVNKPQPVSSRPTSKSVEIRKIQNGFVVSTWTPKGQKEQFAKTQNDAKAIAGKMF